MQLHTQTLTQMRLIYLKLIDNWEAEVDQEAPADQAVPPDHTPKQPIAVAVITRDNFLLDTIILGTKKHLKWQLT